MPGVEAMLMVVERKRAVEPVRERVRATACADIEALKVFVDGAKVEPGRETCESLCRALLPRIRRKRREGMSVGGVVRMLREGGLEASEWTIRRTLRRLGLGRKPRGVRSKPKGGPGALAVSPASSACLPAVEPSAPIGSKYVSARALERLKEGDL